MKPAHLRSRYELRRVDEARRVFTECEADFYRFDEAVLNADASVYGLGGEWVIWDSRDKSIAWDSRKLKEKYAQRRLDLEPK